MSNELGVSMRAADALIDLAWTLERRLALTAAALTTGVISLAKARAGELGNPPSVPQR